MKTLTTKIQKALPLVDLILLTGVSSAQTTYSYQMIVTNQIRISPKIYQFDVFVLNTSTPAGTTQIHRIDISWEISLSGL